MLAPDALSVPHPILPTELALHLLHLPHLVGGQDGKAVAVGAVCPVQLVLVRLDPPIKGRREDTLPIETRRDDDCLFKNSKNVPKHNKFAQLDIHRQPGHDLSQNCQVAILLALHTSNRRQQCPHLLESQHSAPDTSQVGRIHGQSQQVFGRAHREQLHVKDNLGERNSCHLRFMILRKPSAEVFRHQAIDSPTLVSNSTCSSFPLDHLALTCPLQHEPWIVCLGIGDHVLCEAEVDDVADIGDRQGALCDVRAEDHFSLIERQRLKNCLMFLPWHRGMQCDTSPFRTRAPFLGVFCQQEVSHLLDLLKAR